MMFYKFDSVEEFDLWHKNIKMKLGYPLNDGITTAYTELLTKDDGELYAFVDDEYAQGLLPTNPPSFKPRI